MSDVIVSLILLGTLIAMLLFGLTLLIKGAVDVARLYAPSTRKPRRPQISRQDTDKTKPVETPVERAA